MLDNLLTNADKYSPREKPIDIFISSDDESIEVCVRDHGIGLGDATTESIFTPFYRAPAARLMATGIGLGLAVCQRIIEVRGGNIQAVSRAEGGADFIFRLPLREDTGE